MWVRLKALLNKSCLRSFMISSGDDAQQILAERSSKRLSCSLESSVMESLQSGVKNEEQASVTDEMQEPRRSEGNRAKEESENEDDFVMDS